MDGRTRPDLDGVPETLLWNLYQRASEARRPDSVLLDPVAVEVVETLDYPFAERFGGGDLGQWQALRARCFDKQVRRFLDANQDGTVVALGEGLETQFWRVDNGRVHWVAVELPETVRLREQVLPAAGPRQRTVAGSVLDPDWMAQVQPPRTAPASPLLLTAQGLLMYLQPDDVHRLMADCAAHFPGSTLVFDGVPPWFRARTVRGQMVTAQGYRTPPMPWAIDRAEKGRLRALPGVASVVDVRRPRGRGLLHGFVLPALDRVPGAHDLGLAGLPVLRAQFAPSR